MQAKFKCPACRKPVRTAVKSSRLSFAGVNRRRQCELCAHRWTTVERPKLQADAVKQAIGFIKGVASKLPPNEEARAYELAAALIKEWGHK